MGQPFQFPKIRLDQPGLDLFQFLRGEPGGGVQGHQSPMLLDGEADVHKQLIGNAAGQRPGDDHQGPLPNLPGKKLQQLGDGLVWNGKALPEKTGDGVVLLHNGDVLPGVALHRDDGVLDALLLEGLLIPLPVVGPGQHQGLGLYPVDAQGPGDIHRFPGRFIFFKADGVVLPPSGPLHPKGSVDGGVEGKGDDVVKHSRRSP